MKSNDYRIHKSYLMPFVRFGMIMLIIYGISGLLFKYSEDKIENDHTQESKSKNACSIILTALNNNDLIDDENLVYIQEFIREYEKEFQNGNKFALSKDYNIFIDRDSRKLMIENTQGLQKPISASTIDTTRTISSNTFISHNATYFMDDHCIKKYYLGTEKIIKAYLEHPKILLDTQDALIITEDSSLAENKQNYHLLLLSDNNPIELTQSYSQIPIEKDGPAIYFIDSDLGLYMYNTITHETRYIYSDVYELYYSSGVNFRSKNGLFRINLVIEPDGKEKKINIHSNETDQLVSDILE